MFRNLVATSILALALIAGCTDKSARSDAQAPDFSLQDMGGRSVRLSDYKGKVVLLEFWATWCPPCRASIPGLEKLDKTYKDKGLAVLAVSVDQGGWDAVQFFIKENGINYTVLKGDDEVASKYQVRTIPLMLVLDKQGRIVNRYLGYGNDEELERDIKASL